MNILQLDFFKTASECEVDVLRKEFEDVKASASKVRKGIFARHNELAKMYVDVVNRLDILERNLCKQEMK